MKMRKRAQLTRGGLQPGLSRHRDVSRIGCIAMLYVHAATELGTSSWASRGGGFPWRRKPTSKLDDADAERYPPPTPPTTVPRCKLGGNVQYDVTVPPRPLSNRTPGRHTFKDGSLFRYPLTNVHRNTRSLSRLIRSLDVPLLAVSMLRKHHSPPTLARQTSCYLVVAINARKFHYFFAPNPERFSTQGLERKATITSYCRTKMSVSIDVNTTDFLLSSRRD